MRGHGKDELFVEVSSAFVKVNSTNHERGGIYFYISDENYFGENQLDIVLSSDIIG